MTRKIWTFLIHLDAFFWLTLICTRFPWTNVMQLSKQSLVRWRRFYDYHCPDGNTYNQNHGSFKKYLKFRLTIHINPNSYSFRIMFIMIIVRFVIICSINGLKYEKVATNWERVTNWCIYPSENRPSFKIISLLYKNSVWDSRQSQRRFEPSYFYFIWCVYMLKIKGFFMNLIPDRDYLFKMSVAGIKLSGTAGYDPKSWTQWQTSYEYSLHKFGSWYGGDPME